MTRTVVLVLLVVVLTAAGAAGYVLLSEEPLAIPGLGETSDSPLGDDLASSTSNVSLTVDVKLPKGFGNHKESFTGEGTVEFAEGFSAMLYDFEELNNAAGLFGHLEEFEVVFTDAGTYVDVFNGRPRWLLIAESNDVARADVGRLREVVLSSPQLLTTLVRAAESNSEAQEGPQAVTIASLDPDTEAAAQVVALLEELEIEEVTTSFQAEDESVDQVDYKIKFPVAPGKTQKVVVTLHALIDESEESAEIKVPNDKNVRELSDFFS